MSNWAMKSSTELLTVSKVEGNIIHPIVVMFSKGLVKN